MFYRLVSDEVLSNTFKKYKGFVQAARSKDSGENGYISPFAFSDDSRHIEDINVPRLRERSQGTDDDIPKKVTVLYFGDYDPTGCAMSYNIEGWLEPYNINFVSYRSFLPTNLSLKLEITNIIQNTSYLTVTGWL